MKKMPVSCIIRLRWETYKETGMSTQQKLLEEKIKELPPEFQKEVKDFVDFLHEKRMEKPRSKPQFKWAGALKELRDKYTSVELQHKISEWRIGGK